MAPPVNVGQVLAGKYQIERVLGMGGMGVVVAARHLQLEERVAIKFLQAEGMKDPSVVARFLREAKAAAKIRSEHVARVFDVGTLDDGAPYLVMEYLDGRDLSETVKKGGPLPVAVAVEYVLQACEALAEAHAAGIIHRDLKPANLFVTARADGSHVVKVIDFGISKMPAGGVEGLDITKTAEMRGSLLFMPPEQMARPRDVDPRSDIWAIGVSLFNLLTGAYPFPAETAPELCAKVFHADPVLVRAHRPDVPPGLEAAILRCLRKNPAERFANVAELAGALVEFGTATARVSTERISRTLGVAVGSWPAQVSVGAMAQTPPGGYAHPGAASPQPGLSNVAGYPAPPGAIPTGSGVPAGEPAQTGRSTWGSTARPPDTKRRSGGAAVVVAALGVVLAVVVSVVVLSMRKSGADAASPAAPVADTAAPSDPAALAGTGAPAISVSPAAAGTMQPVVEPIAPAPSAAASSSASQPAGGPPTATTQTQKPRTAPEPRPTSTGVKPPKKDLFENPL